MKPGRSPSPRVKCLVEEVDLVNESGRTVKGVRATCSRCDHEEESYGRAPPSIKRCLALMRENCEQGEENYYAAEND